MTSPTEVTSSLVAGTAPAEAAIVLRERSRGQFRYIPLAHARAGSSVPIGLLSSCAGRGRWDESDGQARGDRADGPRPLGRLGDAHRDRGVAGMEPAHA